MNQNNGFSDFEKIKNYNKNMKMLLKLTKKTKIQSVFNIDNPNFNTN